MKTTHTHFWRFVLVAALLGVALATHERGAKSAPAFATITVDSTNDDFTVDNGNCDLREAILSANLNIGIDACAAGAPGLDMIVFAVGAGTPTINLMGALPVITEQVMIDGATGGATRIEINGAGAGAGVNGLEVAAGALHRLAGADGQKGQQGQKQPDHGMSFPVSVPLANWGQRGAQ